MNDSPDAVYQSTGDYKADYQYYKDLFESSPPEKKTAARRDLVIASVNYGMDLTEEDAYFLLSDTIAAGAVSSEKSRIITARGKHYYTHFEYRKAIPFFESLEKEKISSTDSVLFHSFSYYYSGDLNATILVLNRGLQEATENKMICDYEIYRSLADRLLERENRSGNKKFTRTIEVYESHLLSHDKRERAIFINYAKFLRLLEMHQRMNEVCNAMLSGKVFPLPVREEDFYYDGWANYLLGREERARYDYERSREYLEYYR